MKTITRLNATSSNLNLVCQSQKHAFHILDASPYPFLVSFVLLALLSALTMSMHGLALPLNLPRSEFIHVAFCGLVLVTMKWFSSIVVESGEGYHTSKVQHGLRTGVILFILSEVMLFFAFFWGFFHYSLVPSVASGAMWPPEGTQELDPSGLPLGNTLLLLFSGVTVTAAHAWILQDKSSAFSGALALTVILGVVFLMCQAYEYKYGVKFTWRENVFGSIFFLTTGFHGMHVTVGTLFLIFCLGRHFVAAATKNTSDAINCGFTAQQHLGFEAAAWYWHFVDVVWLFLYVSIYWWGHR